MPCVPCAVSLRASLWERLLVHQAVWRVAQVVTAVRPSRSSYFSLRARVVSEWMFFFVATVETRLHKDRRMMHRRRGTEPTHRDAIINQLAWRTRQAVGPRGRTRSLLRAGRRQTGCDPPASTCLHRPAATEAAVIVPGINHVQSPTFHSNMHL